MLVVRQLPEDAANNPLKIPFKIIQLKQAGYGHVGLDTHTAVSSLSV